MHISLASKLKELEQCKVLKLVSDPDRHYFPGEGRLTYEGHPLDFLADYTGPSPDGSDLYWDKPHDVAWCAAKNLLIAYAPCFYEQFKPIPKITIKQVHAA